MCKTQKYTFTPLTLYHIVQCLSSVLYIWGTKFDFFKVLIKEISSKRMIFSKICQEQ